MGSPAGKAFNARLPEALHQVIKLVASQAAQKAGGQTNMNKVMVESLYGVFRDRLSEEDRKAVETFISKL
jgi:hypothetical protein